MTSELSIFATRVADFIGICASELAGEHHQNPDYRNHADIEFNGMALMLFTLQFQQNAAYRKLCEGRRVTPDAVHHWTQIPAVPTSAFKELEVSSLAPEKRTHVFHSSGTTVQKPSRHFHNRESLAVYEASLLPWLRFHVEPTKNLAILTPPPLQAPNSSLVHMFETIRREFAAPEASFVGTLDSEGAWTLTLDRASVVLENASRAGKPLVLLGTAFSFVHLLDHLNERALQFDLPPGSQAMETGGYKNRSRTLPKNELHALITERLGISPSHILCEYGMSELSSQAYQRGRGDCASHFHFPPWARAQVISPESGREVAEGETGLLRVFDLANVFSAMAIQTEDLAIRRADGFELLGRAATAESRGCSLLTT